MKSKNKLLLLFAFIFTLLVSSCGSQNSKTPPEPIQGWNQYEVENVSFQLPDTYRDDTDWYKENYPDESINTIVFFTTSNESKNAIQNVFIVNKIEMEGRVNFDEYIDGYIDYISAVYEVTSHSKINDMYPTEKIILAAENEYGQNTGLTYVTYIGSSIYLIEFQCGADLFDQYESEFQTIYENIFVRENFLIPFIQYYRRLILLIFLCLIIIFLLVLRLIKRKKETDSITSVDFSENS